MSAVRAWRRSPRVIPHPDRPVECRLTAPLMCGLGRLTDISVGGAEISLPEDIDPAMADQELIVELSLPGGRTLTLPGRVRHLEGHRLGVCFIGAEPWQQRMLRRYIEQERADYSLRTRLRRFFRYVLRELVAPAPQGRAGSSAPPERQPPNGRQ